MIVEGCAECGATRETCPDCRRPIASEHDEGIHNTGECGCETARSLCWRTWNGNVCAPLSPFDSKEQSLCKLCWKPRFTWQVFCGAACSAKWEGGERPAIQAECTCRGPGDVDCPKHKGSA